MEAKEWKKLQELPEEGKVVNGDKSFVMAWV